MSGRAKKRKSERLTLDEVMVFLETSDPGDPKITIPPSVASKILFEAREVGSQRDEST